MDHQAFAQLLGNYGEFFGSIAVIATLAYLTVQVYQTKQAVQSASHQTGVATMTQNNQVVFADQELSEIIVRGFADDLDVIERFRFGLWCTSVFHVFQQYFLASQKGLAHASVWAGESRAMRALLANPGVVRWWREMPGLPYSEDFVNYVEATLSRPQDTDQFRRLREGYSEPS